MSHLSKGLCYLKENVKPRERLTQKMVDENDVVFIWSPVNPLPQCSQVCLCDVRCLTELSKNGFILTILIVVTHA